MVAKKPETSTESETPTTDNQDPRSQSHAHNIKQIDAAARRLQEEKQKREDEIKNSELGVKLSEIRSNRAELVGYEEKSTQSLY